MLLKKILPIIILFLGFSNTIQAQVTTSSISGVIKSKAGSLLPGATITAIQLSTGTVYTAVARTGGRFDINNMNPGGPYTITISYTGFEDDKREDIYLVLGDELRLDVQLKQETKHRLAAINWRCCQL